MSAPRCRLIDGLLAFVAVWHIANNGAGRLPAFRGGPGPVRPQHLKGARTHKLDRKGRGHRNLVVFPRGKPLGQAPAFLIRYAHKKS